MGKSKFKLFFTFLSVTCLSVFYQNCGGSFESISSLEQSGRNSALSPGAIDSPVKAFPTAEGFGKDTMGGRGGRVIEVTNTNDSGNGSLRGCAEATGKRTCVFKTGGTITLRKSISIRAANSFLTIAGQTAPGGGIQIKNWGIIVNSGAEHVIIRHIKVRQGTDQSPQDINNDCVGILVWGSGGAAVRPVSNVIIDHVSVEWTCDDSISIFGRVRNATLQWSLIGEGLDRSDYRNSAGEGPGNKGGLFNGRGNTMSVHHNLYVHSGSRNPNAAGLGGDIATLDWRNNIVYNWNSCHGNTTFGWRNLYQQGDASILANLVGNKYLAGPNTSMGGSCGLGGLQGNRTKIYFRDNESPFCKNGCSTLADFGFLNGDNQVPIVGNGGYATGNPIPGIPPIAMTSLKDLDSVLSNNVGAWSFLDKNVPVRDALDRRLVGEFQNRGGSMGRDGAPYPNLARGNSPRDSDKDGMPDKWESDHGLNPNSPPGNLDGPKTAANGYTNLENYLNELAGDPAATGSASSNSGPSSDSSDPAPSADSESRDLASSSAASEPSALQSSDQLPSFAGCGSVGGPPQGPGAPPQVILLILFLPIITWKLLLQKQNFEKH